MEKEFIVKLKAITLDKIGVLISAGLQSGGAVIEMTNKKTKEKEFTTLAEITIDIKKEIFSQVEEQLKKKVKEKLKEVSKKSIKSKK